jgi:hypothetical protein
MRSRSSTALATPEDPPLLEEDQSLARFPRWPWAVEPGLARAFAPFSSTVLTIFSTGDRVLASAQRLALSPTIAATLLPGRTYRPLNPLVTRPCAGPGKSAAFVGDVLFSAGFQAPLVRDADGEADERRYADVADWPRAISCFDLVQDLRRIRRGDLVVYASRVCLVEVISHVAPASKGGAITTLGARRMGLVEDQWLGDRLRAARRDGAGWATTQGRPALLSVLRARRHVGEGPCLPLP